MGKAGGDVRRHNVTGRCNRLDIFDLGENGWDYLSLTGHGAAGMAGSTMVSVVYAQEGDRMPGMTGTCLWGSRGVVFGGKGKKSMN